MNQSPLSTVVSVRKIATDTNAIHCGKQSKPTHSYLIHKISNQCHYLAGRKSLGEQICQVSCCVLLRQPEHASSYWFSAIVIGNNVLFISQWRLWCWCILVNGLVVTKYISGTFNRNPKHTNFLPQHLYQFHSILRRYELRTKSWNFNSVLSLTVSNKGCLVSK